MKRTWKQISSLFLSVCMVVTMLPVTAFAKTETKDSGAGLGTGGKITAFAELDTEVSQQTKEIGTAEDELNLPKKLAATLTEGGDDIATVSDATKETPITVEVSDWISDPVYDGDAEGVYTFTPVLALADSVTVAEGVYAPTITVTVEEQPAAPQARGAGPSGIIEISNQSDWVTLTGNTSAIPATGGVILLNTDVTGELQITSAVTSLTIDGGTGHSIEGYISFSNVIDLTLKDLTVRPTGNGGSNALDVWKGGMLTTLGTVSLTGDNSTTIAGSGVFSGDTLTLTASDSTTFTGGSGDIGGKGVNMQNGSLTLNGGSPQLTGGSGASGFGVNTQNGGGLTITSGSPSFTGGVTSSGYGMAGASIADDLTVTSSDSPAFTGADGIGRSSGTADGATIIGNLLISAGTPVFKGGAASGTSGSDFAGSSVYVYNTTIISGDASPTFTGGNGAASGTGGEGASQYGSVTVSTSGTATFTAGANQDNGLIINNGSANLDLTDLTGTFTATGGTKAFDSAAPSYPAGLDGSRKYDGTAASYTLDMTGGGTVVDAETPSITGQPVGTIYDKNAPAAALSVAASVTDGGTLSYQWYYNLSNNTTSGHEIGGATNSSYTPDTASAGTVYYYCVVTNTNDSVTGNKTATASSNTAAITVIAPSGSTVNYSTGTFDHVIGNNGIGGVNGYAGDNNANASGNTVNVTGGVVNQTIQGGRHSTNPGDNAAANSNTVNIEPSFGGGASLNVCGGWTYVDNIGSYTGKTAAVTGNTVNVSGGEFNLVFGGSAGSADGPANATGNTVNFSGGTAAGIYGGSATIRAIASTYSAASSGNSVVISSGTVTDFICGGHSSDYPSSVGNATNNTVTVTSAPDLRTANLYGGFIQSYYLGAPGSASGNAFSGNALNWNTSGLTVAGVKNFEHINFNLPSAVTNGAAALTVGTAADLSGVTVGFDIPGAVPALALGDTITLISSVTGTPASLPAPFTKNGYTFTISISSNALIATVTAAPGGGIPTVASISGTIKGSDTNSGINGATMQLKNTSGGWLSTTTTNFLGQYSFDGLVAGTYSIEASATGYSTGTISSIVLGTANASDKDLTLTKTSATTTHAVTVNGSYASATGAGSYAKDTTVSIYAGDRSNYTFTGWTSSDVSITSASSKNASFVMPDKAVTVTAGWSYNGGGRSGDGGGSYTPPVTTPPTTTTPEVKPNQPVTAAAPVTATAGTNGSASASIPEKSITDAITKAQADAKAQGKTANGTTVALNVTMPEGATSLTLNLSRNSLNSLVSAGVASLELNGSPVTVSFDTKALAEIQKQSSGNISITIAPNTSLSAAAKGIIGTRPVYDLTVSYQKDGKNVVVSGFGGGTATVSVPYTPAKGEAVGGLYAVYVDEKGNANRITGSAYDANSGCVIFTTTHFSLYGIGYTALSAKFTDMTSHWTKESIDYVVGRGLLSGTTETTFAPDTAMTRGMLVIALGRLANVDMKAYTANSFTDVKTDSAFRPYIEWAYKKGIVQGTGNGKFEPDRAVTREEIAVIFSNYAKATGYTLPVTRTATAYMDAASIGDAYKAAVTAMQQAGIMMGGASNKFNPKSSATRAEVSSMLHRYIKLAIDPATAQGWALNDAGQYLYYKDSKVLTGTQIISGVKYFFNIDGTLKTGWIKDGDNWRYYSGNIMLVGFWDIGANSSNKTYYFAKDGIMVAGKWLEIDGKWYYFNGDGSLAKSTKIDGHEVDEKGVRKTK